MASRLEQNLQFLRSRSPCVPHTLNEFTSTAQRPISGVSLGLNTTSGSLFPVDTHLRLEPLLGERHHVLVAQLLEQVRVLVQSETLQPHWYVCNAT